MVTAQQRVLRRSPACLRKGYAAAPWNRSTRCASSDTNCGGATPTARTSQIDQLSTCATTFQEAVGADCSTTIEGITITAATSTGHSKAASTRSARVTLT